MNNNSINSNLNPNLNPNLSQNQKHLNQHIQKIQKKAHKIIQNNHLKPFETYIAQHAQQQSAAFIQAINDYHNHPTPPHNYNAEQQFKLADTRLYRINPPKPNAQPILLIPSLVNKAYIMHLTNKTSLAKYLHKNNCDVWILEWHTNNSDKIPTTFNQYLNKLHQATNTIKTITNSTKISLLGYCIGGIFALALAQTKPQSIKSISLIATPWDFSAYNSPYHSTIIQGLQHISNNILKLNNSNNTLPPDIIPTYFHLINPTATLRKFLNFANIPKYSQQAHQFVAIEDWLNHNSPLNAKLATTLCQQWFIDNKTLTQQFKVKQQILNPKLISIPTQIAIANTDRIVPPKSTLALSKTMPHAQTITINLGHIGMMTSQKAENLLWQKIAQFFNANQINGAG